MKATRVRVYHCDVPECLAREGVPDHPGPPGGWEQLTPHHLEHYMRRDNGIHVYLCPEHVKAFGLRRRRK